MTRLHRYLFTRCIKKLDVNNMCVRKSNGLLMSA